MHHKEDLELLRHNTYIILDWGTADRKGKLEAQCGRDLEHCSKLNAGERATASEAAEGAVESYPIKKQATE